MTTTNITVATPNWSSTSHRTQRKLTYLTHAAVILDHMVARAGISLPVKRGIRTQWPLATAISSGLYLLLPFVFPKLQPVLVFSL